LTDRQQIFRLALWTPPKFSRLDPRQRREQILDAANALFAEGSYDQVSVEDIASSAGVTRGLVHHYFGGRKEVYIALLERLGAMREEQLPPSVGRSARARLADTVSRWLECWTALNRAATRRWLRCEATHELLASTLEHVLRTFGAHPRQTGAHLLPDRRTIEFHARERPRWQQLTRQATIASAWLHKFRVRAERTAAFHVQLSSAPQIWSSRA
jgi:AcrR family transcriptional regulator